MAALHHAKEHEETRRIAGAVDSRRPEYHAIEPLRRHLAKGNLPLPLRLLVVVLGGDRRLFIGGGIGDVPVNALGRAVNHAAHAGAQCLFRDEPRTVDVHALVDAFRYVDLAEGGRDALVGGRARALSGGHASAISNH